MLPKKQIAKYEYSQVIHNDRVSISNKPSDFGLLFTLTLHLYQTEPSFWHSNHPYYPESRQKFSEKVNHLHKLYKTLGKMAIWNRCIHSHRASRTSYFRIAFNKKACYHLPSKHGLSLWSLATFQECKPRSEQGPF